MPADDQLRADLADFTTRVWERLNTVEAKAEEARRIALDALALAERIEREPTRERW